MSEIIGREEELASLHAFVEDRRGGPAALALEGEAGIGKSTLWLAGVEFARVKGFRVLSSRPTEAERTLGFVGLGDLLEGVPDEILPALQAPRRRALEAAMLRGEAALGPLDQRALAVAIRDVLQILSEHEPVLIAVDDAQWLDASSAGTLAFALRRLGAGDVLLLLTRRLSDRSQAARIEQALAPERVRRLPVRGLSLGALHQFLRGRLERAFARQTLLRIHESSGGNPFFALELARALDVDVNPFEPLPVPGTLEDLLRARIAGLARSTREALELVSALGTAAESVLEKAGVGMDALGPAVAAGLIESLNGTIRLTHPLLASVLYQDLGERRRRVHERLVVAVDDPLMRARHLALSKSTPDAAVAAVLDDAASLALARGASAVAAELAEHAVRLTPQGATTDRRRRALSAARAHQAAGEWTRAMTIATDLLTGAEVGAWRAEALVLLSELDVSDRSAELLEQALDEAASRPALQSLIHCRLAWAKRFRSDFDHAGAALELAEQVEDDVLQARARAVQTILGWFAGAGPAPADLLALVEHLPGALGGERLVQEATQAIVNTLAPASTRDTAHAFLEDEYQAWRERDEPRSARALWGLAWLEFWAGRWAVAADHADRAHDIAIQYGLEVPQDQLPIAVIAAHRGQFERAGEHSRRALELAMLQFGFHPPQHLAVLGLVALAGRDAATALDWFVKADGRAALLGWGEPSVRWWTPDHAELLLERSRSDEAVALLDAWEADASRVGRPWVLAHVTRSRGLVAAAGGDVEGALALLEQALAEHDAVGDPFGHARALLALGAVSRRARRKRPAREAIEAAVTEFEAIGAATWAARARGELGRIGGRSAEDGLTQAERRVAELVARGHTNQEVAASLFLGERTVASHLTHIYAKLGIRSRTELARRLR